jgi:hypothetical protein
MRGRKNESGAKTLAWMLLAALCSSAITAFLKGPHPLIAATVFQTVGITAACLYGAVIYRLQLAASRGSNLRPRSVSFSLFPFSFSISQHRMSPSFPWDDEISLDNNINVVPCWKWLLAEL